MPATLCSLRERGRALDTDGVKGRVPAPQSGGFVFTARVTASFWSFLRGRSGSKQQNDKLLTDVFNDDREIKTFFQRVR